MNKARRDFQTVYSFLTLNFLIPSIGYALDPAAAIRQFEAIGRLLGGGAYLPFPGELGYVWRILAAGNVLTLAFMCFLLQYDLKRFYPVLVPLVFMKYFSAVSYLVVYAAAYRYPTFLAVFFYDGLSAWAMVHFARRAFASSY